MSTINLSKTNKVLAYPPLIFTGVKYSGRKKSINYLLTKTNFPFLPLKKFTNNINLASNYPKNYIYFPKEEFERLNRRKEFLSLSIVDNFYEGYIKEPVYESISKSNGICLFFCSYNELIDINSSGFIIEKYAINVVPDNPMHLAEYIFNDKYSKLPTKSIEEEDKLYDFVHYDINISGDQISKNFNSDIFDATITNTYKENTLYNQVDEVIRKFYPFLFNENKLN